MSYSIVLEKKAAKFISKLPQNEKIRILRAINNLPSGDTKKLKGQQDNEYYRLRVGDYRIIYTINNDELIICVVDAGNRGQIYNKY
jgi:mRNA interferase RelE/StbE